ncbi:MAG: hypothetical protein ACJ8AD_11180, partial [Gemmatimonadaceae bacterium]
GTTNALAPAATLVRLGGGGAAASGAALSGDAQRPTPLVPWLLGLALICAVGELAVRARARQVLA